MTSTGIGFQVVQLNIARMIAPMDNPIMQDFFDALEPVNALADTSPGFVWRLQDESGNATSIQGFDDPSLLVNLSVWESVDALKDFVYLPGHLDFLRAKKRWFKPMSTPHLVLWWVPEGQIPTISEARSRLEALTLNGPSPEAFTLSEAFGTP
jgi:hypothetical protein